MYSNLFGFISVSEPALLTLKVMKWPPSPSGTFSADSKRRLELSVESLSVIKLKQEISATFHCKTNLKLYYFDGLDVMPVAGECDLKYFLDRFLENYSCFDNHADMNRVYFVESLKVECNEPDVKDKNANKRKHQTPASELPLNEKDACSNEKFAVRVKKRFPEIDILEGCKFRCKCGKVWAMNGKNRIANIIRHVNTTCTLRDKQKSQNIARFFDK